MTRRMLLEDMGKAGLAMMALGTTACSGTPVEAPHRPGNRNPFSGVLVAGDALNGEGGGVVGPNPGFSEDMTMANSSVIKLAGFGYEVALFGHGEPVVSGASRTVGALADTL